MIVPTQDSMNQWIYDFDSGRFNDSDIITQAEAGWSNWECENDRVVNQTRFVAPKIKFIAESGMVDPQKTFVQLYNGTLVNDKTYNEIAVREISTNRMLLTFQFYSDRTMAIFGDTAEPLFEGLWSDAKEWMKNQ